MTLELIPARYIHKCDFCPTELVSDIRITPPGWTSITVHKGGLAFNDDDFLACPQCKMVIEAYLVKLKEGARHESVSGM